MPKSRSRRKDDYRPPERREGKVSGVTGRWVLPTMVTLLILGLLWIVVYYLAREEIPFMNALGGWNLLIGMGSIVLGFIVSTQWK